MSMHLLYVHIGLQDVPEGSLTSSELLKRYGELTEDGKVEIFRMTSVMQEEYGDSTLNPKASHVSILKALIRDKGHI